MEDKIKKIQQAKMYMDYLANGVDPVNNTDVDSNTLHREEVIDCFRYVSDILEEKINYTTNARSREKFYITEEQISNIRILQYNCKVSELAEVINIAAEENGTRKLSATKINDWLESEGYLIKSELRSRIPTVKGKQLGITTELRKRDDGSEYYINFYSEKTQKFVIDHISNIAKFRNKHDPVIQVPTIEFPSNLSVKEFIHQHQDKCFIISIGSCDSVSNTGSYLSVLLFRGKSKVLKKTSIPTNSANKCILSGFLDAANAIKFPTEIVILSSTPLGFNTLKSTNYKFCQEICQILIEKECRFSTAVCQGKGYELNSFLKSLAER